MTPKARSVLLLAALFLCGCDHHKTASHPAPAPSGDSELTGVPAQPIDSMVKTPPRAALVALPPGYAPPPTNLAQNPAPANAQPPAAPAEAVPPPVSAASDSTAPSPSPAEAAPPAPVVTGNLPAPNQNQLVVIETSYGRIVIELDDFAAPKTCKNFRQLVEDGFYNNTVFHRVIPNFIIQGGDPKSKSSATDRNTYGLGGPGYTLPAEIELKHDRGAVAMARLPDLVNPQRESNGSQFYICLAPSPSLDDQYTVFGHVTEGMEVADKIAEAPRDKRDNPLARVEMTMSLETKDPSQAQQPAP
jgi:peptidyl-prolyl cis-trans isomerase B (cyclophilin B)